MQITPEQTAELLRAQDDILILCHAHPDGDTLGSGFGLCRALRDTGKRAAVLCGDPIPKRYAFMAADMSAADFEPRFIVAVDIATVKLMGEDVGARYGERVDLCIDHHYTNSLYARQVLLDAKAAAASEIIYDLLRQMPVQITPFIADCLYVGLSTDTGCFRYSNVTSRSLRTAADLLDCGADNERINRELFETKSRALAALERMAMNSLELHFGDLCATVTVTQDMFRESGASEDEFDKIAAIPRRIEGVLVGASIREQKNGTYKISVRTNPPVNASEICIQMGGGGHPAAAGCTLEQTLEDSKKTLLRIVGDELRKASLL